MQSLLIYSLINVAFDTISHYTEHGSFKGIGLVLLGSAVSSVVSFFLCGVIGFPKTMAWKAIGLGKKLAVILTKAVVIAAINVGTSLLNKFISDSDWLIESSWENFGNYIYKTFVKGLVAGALVSVFSSVAYIVRFTPLRKALEKTDISKLNQYGYPEALQYLEGLKSTTSGVYTKLIDGDLLKWYRMFVSTMSAVFD